MIARANICMLCLVLCVRVCPIQIPYNYLLDPKLLLFLSGLACSKSRENWEKMEKSSWGRFGRAPPSPPSSPKYLSRFSNFSMVASALT
mmetsp:Transcript_36993/g.89885  ORF Transcript_36993/g.89885 Transcript_36993/m.89885 type:complete len:89 (+) Transcript_36993:487-753(+)